MLDKTDAVDHKLAVLVSADGFAEPGGFRIGGVLAVEIDTTHLMVALPYHPHLLWGLDERERLKKQCLAGGAAGPTPRLGGESAVAVLPRVVVHAHLGGRPRGQMGVLVIGEALDTRQHRAASGRRHLPLDAL